MNFEESKEKMLNKCIKEEQKNAILSYYNNLWEYIAAYDKWNTMELLDWLEDGFARLKKLGIDTNDQDLMKFWEVL